MLIFSLVPLRVLKALLYTLHISSVLSTAGTVVASVVAAVVGTVVVIAEEGAVVAFAEGAGKVVTAVVVAIVVVVSEGTASTLLSPESRIITARPITISNTQPINISLCFLFAFSAAKSLVSW